MWFSALLKVAVSVADTDDAGIWRTVVIFEADDDWDAARLKAVDLGRAKEQAFANAEGDVVTHRFLAVETLDMLGERLEDGREVYSERVAHDGSEFPTTDPSEIQPGQSGV